MTARVNDVWTAEFTPPAPGRYQYAVTAWVDHFESWRHDLTRRDDYNDIRIALQVGAGLIEAASRRAHADDAAALSTWAALLRDTADDTKGRSDAAAMKAIALDPARASMAARYADRRFAASVTRELIADRKRAQFSTWYELFPRSAAGQPKRHGTFRDVEARLQYVAQLGFDVLYLPPIHPIGRINRKGANNALTAGSEDGRQPVGHRFHRGGAQGHPAAIGDSAGFQKPRPEGARIPASTLPSILPSNALPIIRTFARTPSGSGTAPTEACNTPKIRPRSTRTFIRSISRATTGRTCGRN